MEPWPHPTGRGPAGRSAGRSPRSTSSALSRSTTTRKARASGLPCSVAREFTPQVFPSGGGRAIKRLPVKYRKESQAARHGRRLMPRTSGSGGKTRSSPPSLPRVERQSLLRGRVQDPEVLPGFPGKLGLGRRGPRVLRAFLHLLQHRAPPLPDRPEYPGIRSRRHLAANPQTPPAGPRRRLRGPPGPLPRTPPAGPGPARPGLDQPAPADHRVTGGPTPAREGWKPSVAWVALAVLTASATGACAVGFFNANHGTPEGAVQAWGHPSRWPMPPQVRCPGNGGKLTGKSAERSTCAPGFSTPSSATRDAGMVSSWRWWTR
jgi:hypothetical protein